MNRSLPRAAALWLLALLLPAQSLEEFEKRVTEFTLANGMHFTVLERHQAPVVSFHAYVNAGGVDDPGGKTGLAHMFEHMIGKGTVELGSTNYAEEEKALAAVESAYDKLENERRKGPRADAQVIEELEALLRGAVEKANSFVEQNEYIRVIQENGAVGFNAGTGSDYTVYFYSLPANRIELWFLLQSEWFRHPVYREFYKERDVVREERRMFVESNPQGKLQEMLLATAFTVQPYRTLVGWASDIENVRATDAAEFHSTYYVPGNITVAVAGDVDPEQVKRLAAKYFSRLRPGPLPPGVISLEPPQEGEKRVEVESPSQPFLMIAYKRPDQRHKDDPVFDVVSGILSSGRTSLLYKELVRDKKIALAASTAAAFPSGKYPNLFVFFSVPAMGHTVEENEKAIYEIIDRLTREKIDETTLQRVKTKIRAGLIRQLASNSGLAGQLAFYQVNYGDWRTLFTGIEQIEKVTADDVQRVAREYFEKKTRTVACIVKPEEEEGK